MEDKSKSSMNKNGGVVGTMIRKGPWKAEEDQVLLNHVNNNGPRDWSSIRSNGLLHRTGKSCRLRWVNKLRPNLKNGCKFTAEEERVVIELQAQLGNKWATIAKHLAGRTDNDVKNFWSSRQKRLVRILHQSHSLSPHHLPNRSHKSSSSSSSSSSTSSTTTTTTTTLTCTTAKPKRNSSSLSLQATKGCSLMEGGGTSSKRRRIASLSYTEPTPHPIPMPPFPNLQNPISYTDSEANNNPINTELPNINDKMNFPSIPNIQTDLIFHLETQELIDRLDSSFLEPFGCPYKPSLVDDGFQLVPCLRGEESSSSQMGTKGTASDDPMPPDTFFDDFPLDMFDQIEPLPSPPGW